MKLKDLQSLFVHELRDLYSAEKQLTKALPKMARAASNGELRSGFEHHLEQTKAHVDRLVQELLSGRWRLTHQGVAFDTEAPTQRHVEFADYKATRQEMPEDLSAALPHVRRMVEALNIPVLICDGYEADDIIGTLARQGSAAGMDVFIVSGDEDLFQLVNEKVRVLKPSSRSSDGETLCDAEKVKEIIGVAPQQVVDWLALTGDSVDNVPGIPGIGIKTAAQLITEYGDVETLLSRASEMACERRPYAPPPITNAPASTKKNPIA